MAISNDPIAGNLPSTRSVDSKRNIFVTVRFISSFTILRLLDQNHLGRQKHRNALRSRVVSGITTISYLQSKRVKTKAHSLRRSSRALPLPLDLILLSLTNV